MTGLVANQTLLSEGHVALATTQGTVYVFMIGRPLRFARKGKAGLISRPHLMPFRRKLIKAKAGVVKVATLRAAVRDGPEEPGDGVHEHERAEFALARRPRRQRERHEPGRRRRRRASRVGSAQPHRSGRLGAGLAQRSVGRSAPGGAEHQPEPVGAGRRDPGAEEQAAARALPQLQAHLPPPGFAQ